MANDTPNNPAHEKPSAGQIFGLAAAGLIFIAIMIFACSSFWLGPVFVYHTELDDGSGGRRTYEGKLSNYQASEEWLKAAIGCHIEAPDSLAKHVRAISGTVDRVFESKQWFGNKAGSWSVSTVYISLKDVPNQIFAVTQGRLCDEDFHAPQLGAPVYAFGMTNPGDKVDIYYFENAGVNKDDNDSQVNLILGYDDATTKIKGYAPWYIRKLAKGEITIPTDGAKDTTPLLPFTAKQVN